MTVRKALPSVTAVADVGGPTRRPPTNVPFGDDTEDTAGTWESCACIAAHLGGADPVGIGNDNGQVRRKVVSEIGAELITHLARRGSMSVTHDRRASPHFADMNGKPSRTSSAEPAIPIGIARRITNFANR